MTNDKQSINEPKDGFDLIEYPCDYMLKAMCRVVEGQDNPHELSQLVIEKLNKQALGEVKKASSRTGKFESITMTIRLQNRQQLEAVYEAVVSSPSVVMTL